MRLFSPLMILMVGCAAFEIAELVYRGVVVWHKTNPGTVHRPVYLSSCEAIIWATKGKRYFFRPWANGGARQAHNCIDEPICQGDERLNHPAQKPLRLLEQLLERHAPPNGRVLDPFAGVASTLVACNRKGLCAVGIEREAKYLRQGRLRLRAETGRVG